MKKSILKSKFCSKAGASVVMALLMFLVCAVVCSVIITAATAAAGRIAGIAEIDQRYYSVSSAALLLKDVLSDTSVTYTETKDSEGNVTVSGLDLETIPKEAAYRYYQFSKDGGSIGAAASRVWELSSDGIEGVPPGEDPLCCTIEESIDSSGNLLFSIKNKNGKPYNIEARFTPDVATESDPKAKTKTTTITWRYAGISAVAPTGGE